MHVDNQPETIIEIETPLMDKVRDGSKVTPLMDKVRDGSKVVSIRPGRLDYPLGPALIRDAGGVEEDIEVNILRLSYSRLKHVPYVDLAVWAGDMTTHAVLRDVLSKHYPGITMDDEVTVIRFQLAS